MTLRIRYPGAPPDGERVRWPDEKLPIPIAGDFLDLPPRRYKVLYREFSPKTYKADYPDPTVWLVVEPVS